VKGLSALLRWDQSGQRPTWSLLWLFLVAVFLGACGETGEELPTGVPSPASDPSTAVAGALNVLPLWRKSSCSVQVRMEPVGGGGQGATSHQRRPGGWRHGHGAVWFGPDELARDGAVILYQFRGYEDGTNLVSAADCVIPRSTAAIRRMNAVFGVVGQLASKRGLRIPGPRASDTQCVESTCTLANLYVSACSWGGIWPNCYSRPQSQAAVQCGALDPACGGWGGSEDPWSWDGGGGADPNPPEDTIKNPCNTPYPLLNDTAIQVKFAEAWAASGYETLPVQERREHGGWIMVTPEGTLTVQEFPATWHTTPCGIDMPRDAWPPAGTLAMFHTHPFAVGDRLTSCEQVDLPGGRRGFMNYRNESSFADDSALRYFRNMGAPALIGIIIDANKIIAYNGTAAGQTSVDRCGY
jgi:hypothetical protein